MLGTCRKLLAGATRIVPIRVRLRLRLPVLLFLDLSVEALQQFLVSLVNIGDKLVDFGGFDAFQFVKARFCDFDVLEHGLTNAGVVAQAR